MSVVESTLYAPQRLVPFRVELLEGEEAPALPARIVLARRVQLRRPVKRACLLSSFSDSMVYTGAIGGPVCHVPECADGVHPLAQRVGRQRRAV